MKELFIKELFNRNYFVAEPYTNLEDAEQGAAAAVALHKYFGITIKGTFNGLNMGHIKLAAEILGHNVPEPFYRGFPYTVRQLSNTDVFIDKMLHYFRTYGLGDFDGAGHSILEDNIKRVPSDEVTNPKTFEIIDEKTAWDKLREIATNYCASTRPLSEAAYNFVLEYVTETNEIIPFASHNTLIKMLLDTRKEYFMKQLRGNDVIAMVEELLFKNYETQTEVKTRWNSYTITKPMTLNKMRLTNQDKKFVTACIRAMAANTPIFMLQTVAEKKKAWKGLLHQIHFKANNKREEALVRFIFDDDFRSAYSTFERYLAEHKVRDAAGTLYQAKGATAVQRHLARLLSSCTTIGDETFVLEKAFKDTTNTITLLQLIYKYSIYDATKVRNTQRTFTYAYNHKLVTYNEEYAAHQSWKAIITNRQARAIVDYAKNRLAEVLKNSIDKKVYVAPEVEQWAVPMQETVASNGYGSRARGSRVRLDGKTIRLFTYWERVNDIDLSLIGLDASGKVIQEFSWRTFGRTGSHMIGEAVCFSGDQTSGFDGGSEYFDINPYVFKRKYPQIKYLIACNNVFSGKHFNEIVCRAGYMTTMYPSFGNVFDAKNVQTSYTITGDSTMAYLFALDVDAQDFVWLNTVVDSESRVAGTNKFEHLIQLIRGAEIFNVTELMQMCAKEIVDNIEDAEIVVGDIDMANTDADKKYIKSCDLDILLAIANKNWQQ